MILFPHLVLAGDPKEKMAEIYGETITADKLCQVAKECTDQQKGNNLFKLALSKTIDNFISGTKLAVEPTQEEIIAFSQVMDKNIEQIKKTNKQANEILSHNNAENDPAAIQAKNDLSKKFIISWKKNKVLYDQFGGRVLFQQTGMEPIDAYKKLLKQAIKEGNIKITDKSLEDSFWSYVNQQGALVSDSDRGYFKAPWWTKGNK